MNWDDLRIAHQLALSGSLSRAGKALGINHTTVLRRVNALEKDLSVRLFLRHQRGYQLTDAGCMLVKELPDISHRIQRLQGLLHNAEKELSGPLLITTVNDYLPRVTAGLKAFRDVYPKVLIQMIATDEILSLASGVAHVSLRLGAQPHEPDLIARPLGSLHVGYYAASSYRQQYGLPETPEDFNQHFWAMPSGSKRKIPHIRHVIKDLDESRIVYQCNNFQDLKTAVVEGIGIGPVSTDGAERYPDLHRIECIDDAGAEAIWFTYHRDMKDNSKVQVFYDFLKQYLSDCGSAQG